MRGVVCAQVDACHNCIEIHNTFGASHAVIIYLLKVKWDRHTHAHSYTRSYTHIHTCSLTHTCTRAHTPYSPLLPLAILHPLCLHRAEVGEETDKHRFVLKLSPEIYSERTYYIAFAANHELQVRRGRDMWPDTRDEDVGDTSCHSTFHACRRCTHFPYRQLQYCLSLYLMQCSECSPPPVCCRLG